MTALRPVDLRCEYLQEPRGLDTPRPRLSWALEGDGTALRQAAYSICAGSDRSAVATGRGDPWDSEWVAGTESLWIAWQAARRTRSNAPFRS